MLIFVKIYIRQKYPDWDRVNASYCECKHKTKVQLPLSKVHL